MQNTFLDLLSAPEVSKELLSKAAAFAIETGEKAYSKFPLDWLWTGDDVRNRSAK